jgi:hypothetical protein
VGRFPVYCVLWWFVIALLGSKAIGCGLLLFALSPIHSVFYLFLGLGSSDIIDRPARAIGVHLGPGENAL